jgi:hypothetical protein
MSVDKMTWRPFFPGERVYECLPNNPSGRQEGGGGAGLPVRSGREVQRRSGGAVQDGNKAIIKPQISRDLGQ